MELPGFMEAVEGILLWLLGARDVLSNQQAIADDMDCLKEQFHSHEVTTRNCLTTRNCRLHCFSNWNQII